MLLCFPNFFFFTKNTHFTFIPKNERPEFSYKLNKSIGHCCQNCEGVQTRAMPPLMQKACDHIKGHTEVRCGQSVLLAGRKWTWLWALIQLFPSHGPWWVIYHGLSLWSIDRLSFDQSQEDREDHSLLLENRDLACSPHPPSLSSQLCLCLLCWFLS